MNDTCRSNICCKLSRKQEVFLFSVLHVFHKHFVCLKSRIPSHLSISISSRLNCESFLAYKFDIMKNVCRPPREEYPDHEILFSISLHYRTVMFFFRSSFRGIIMGIIIFTSHLRNKWHKVNLLKNRVEILFVSQFTQATVNCHLSCCIVQHQVWSTYMRYL